MKKEVYCMKCKTRVQATIDGPALPPGEHVKYVDGRAKKTMMCDFCSKMIEPGWFCSCFSNYIDGEAPYSPWEADFIEIAAAGAADPAPVPVQGVYGLLASATEDRLRSFHQTLFSVLNFIDARDNTVYCMCMQESLGLAIGTAKNLDVTLQRIEVVDDIETYPVLHKGSHGRWERGGYVDGN